MNAAFTLFKYLYRHGRLAAHRHPMRTSNQASIILSWVMMLFWAGYLVFFGVFFATAFASLAPTREPYHLMNGGVLLIILFLDMLMRIPLQKTPTQEIKPYLLLPLKRQRLIDFLLIRSGLDLFNLFWLFLFIPFALLTVTRFYGFVGVLSYILGIWLLVLINNYWYLLCRTLFDRHWLWILLPIGFYSGLISLFFLFKDQKSDFARLLMDLGDAYITTNPWIFIATLLCIALLWRINSQVMSRLIYDELSKVEDSRVGRTASYHFLDRYGLIGEYMRLELRLLWRNRRCKSTLKSLFFVILLFATLLTFSDVYDGSDFIVMYSYSMFGMSLLLNLFSFEGNYIDGLLTRPGSILHLLRAKYYLYCLAQLIPFTLMLPAIFMGKVTWLAAFSWTFFSIGCTYFFLFRLSVYNKQSVPLNEKLTMKQTNSSLQIIASLVVLGLPIMLFYALALIWSEQVAHYILLTFGLIFFASSPRWINRVYLSWSLRRYENLEGFRNSRQKA